MGGSFPNNGKASQLLLEACEAFRASGAVAPPLMWGVKRRFINLTFHGVGERHRSLDPGEQEVWLSSGHFLSVLDAAADRSDVRITFDDGNASDVQEALPALRNRGLSATFFVVAGRLGAEGFLDEEGVRELVAAGMAIGCHGMRHRPWRSLDERGVREELLDARLILEHIVRAPVTEAACPFGSYDRRVVRSLRRYGYDRVYTSDRGATGPDAWIQPRNTVRQVDQPGLLEHILSSDTAPHDMLRRQAKLAVKRWR